MFRPDLLVVVVVEDTHREILATVAWSRGIRLRRRLLYEGMFLNQLSTSANIIARCFDGKS